MGMEVGSHIAVGQELALTIDLFTCAGAVILCHPDKDQVAQDEATIRRMELDGSLFELEDKKWKAIIAVRVNVQTKVSPRKGPYLLVQEVRTVPLLCQLFYFAGLLFCTPFCLTICLVVHVCVGISEERATSSCTGGSDRAYISCAAGLDSICVCIWRRSVVLWSTEPNAAWPAHMERMFH